MLVEAAMAGLARGGATRQAVAAAAAAIVRSAGSSLGGAGLSERARALVGGLAIHRGVEEVTGVHDRSLGSAVGRAVQGGCLQPGEAKVASELQALASTLGVPQPSQQASEPCAKGLYICLLRP